MIQNVNFFDQQTLSNSLLHLTNASFEPCTDTVEAIKDHDRKVSSHSLKRELVTL